MFFQHAHVLLMVLVICGYRGRRRKALYISSSLRLPIRGTLSRSPSTRYTMRYSPTSTRRKGEPVSEAESCDSGVWRRWKSDVTTWRNCFGFRVRRNLRQSWVISNFSTYHPHAASHARPAASCRRRGSHSAQRAVPVKPRVHLPVPASRHNAVERQAQQHLDRTSGQRLAL